MKNKDPDCDIDTKDPRAAVDMNGCSGQSKPASEVKAGIDALKGVSEQLQQLDGGPGSSPGSLGATAMVSDLGTVNPDELFADLANMNQDADIKAEEDPNTQVIRRRRPKTIDESRKFSCIKAGERKAFKKRSADGSLAVYLGQRDFLHRGDNHVDPIEGVVLVSQGHLAGGSKVFVQVRCIFRHGVDDIDSPLEEGAFHEDLFVACHQVYPVKKEEEEGSCRRLTTLQARLLKKLGSDAKPFLVELPAVSPASMLIHQRPGTSGVLKPCGVDYELKAFIGDSPDAVVPKKSEVRLAIRKLSHAPPQQTGMVSTEVHSGQSYSNSTDEAGMERATERMVSTGNLGMEVTLDKAAYHHGEPVSVHVLIDNHGSRAAGKKVRVSILQEGEVSLASGGVNNSITPYSNTVDELESAEGFPVSAHQTGVCRQYTVTPTLADNVDLRGWVLDGKAGQEDTHLAASTPVVGTGDGCCSISVHYKVRVRLVMGFGTSDVIAEVPFMLTHAAPARRNVKHSSHRSNGEDPVDANLIHLDTATDGGEDHADEDLIFEDFARFRLRSDSGSNEG